MTLLTHGLLLAGAAAAVFLAAGPEQGSLGIFLAAAGLAMIVCPPRVRVDGRLWLAAGGLVACGALAFLPERWFHVPAWRTTLEAIPLIPLPASVTPVPWETAFWLAVLALSALVGLFALAHPLRSAGLLGLATAAVLICAAYTALAIYAKQTGWHYPFSGGAPFGFFPNRNHTATFLVVGSIVSMGVLLFTLREGRWLLALTAGGGLTLNIAALCFFSGSRGGIVFLLVGAVIWLAGLGRAHRNLPLLVSSGALLVAGGALFLVSGSEVRHRLLPTAEDREASAPSLTPRPTGAASVPLDVSLDFRLAVYQDAAGLIRDLPVTGTGLGEFAAVFPQYRQKSLADVAVIHPESDWLMLVTEAGVPAGLCVVWLCWLLLRRVRLWRPSPSWPLRWGLVAAVAAAALHGIVDVPAHRVALGWWVLVLAGAGLHGGWSERTGRSRVQHVVFVLGGLLALALGTQLMRAEWFGLPPLPPFAAALAQAKVFKAYQRENFAEAMQLARLAIQRSPMSEPLYSELGLLLLRTDTDDAEADEVFKAQRLLNPIVSSIPLVQGEAWMNDDPVRTTAFWREALVRRERINHTLGHASNSDTAFYSDLVRRAVGQAVLAGDLLDLAGDDPALVLAWLENAPPDLVGQRIGTISTNTPLLQQLGGGERARFLRVWYARGNRQELEHWLESREDWRTAAWPVHLRQLTDEGRYEQAVRECAAHEGVSLALPEVHLGEVAPADSADPDDAVAEFTADWRRGNVISARRTLAEAGHDPQHPPSPELSRLKAALAVQDARWTDAWSFLTQYLRQTGASVGDGH